METNPKHIETLKSMVQMVSLGENHIYSQKFEDFGKLLNESWELKKSLSAKISSSNIDEVYQNAKSAGAIGGKLLGAGGGGFFLFLCPPEKQNQLRAKLSKVEEIPFKFEEEGAKVVFFGEEGEE